MTIGGMGARSRAMPDGPGYPALSAAIPAFLAAMAVVGALIASFALFIESAQSHRDAFHDRCTDDNGGQYTRRYEGLDLIARDGAGFIITKPPKGFRCQTTEGRV